MREIHLAGDPGGDKQDVRGVVVPDGGGNQVFIAGGFMGLTAREDAVLECKDVVRARLVHGVCWWPTTCLAETGGGR